jgi:hypothetical protein
MRLAKPEATTRTGTKCAVNAEQPQRIDVELSSLLSLRRPVSPRAPGGSPCRGHCMTGEPTMPRRKKDKHLAYGEGPRAEYGEGYRYRKADLSEGGDKVNDLGGFAGGRRPPKPLPDRHKPEGD